jgi:hypothetical protein
MESSYENLMIHAEKITSALNKLTEQMKRIADCLDQRLPIAGDPRR